VAKPATGVSFVGCNDVSSSEWREAVLVLRTPPILEKCQLKPACALYFPAIEILRLDAPQCHECVPLVWLVEEFVSFIVRGYSC
jgi:hypothetical protein